MEKKIKSSKGKAVLCFLVAFLIGGLLLYFGVMFVFKGEKVEVILSSSLTTEIHEDVQVLSFVQNIKNGVILSQDEKIDTSSLGEKEVHLKIKNNQGKEEIYTFKVLVVDTIKPVIKVNDSLIVLVGTDIELLKGVMATDNSGEVINVKINGHYNVNQVGDYALQFVAKDSSHNETIQDFTLHVIERPNERKEIPEDYTFTTSKGFKGEVKNGITYIDGILVVNKTYPIPSSYGNGLLEETRKAFQEMTSDALPLGLNLYISSGYRSYSLQEELYTGYVFRDGKEAADTYSARAGHSEHQTGLAFDLNSVSDDFTNTPEGKWVHENAWRYGLILRYPYGKDSITGYKHESWHLRYVGKELAEKLYNHGDWITLEEYFGIDSKYE